MLHLSVDFDFGNVFVLRRHGRHFLRLLCGAPPFAFAFSSLVPTRRAQWACSPCEAALLALVVRPCLCATSRGAELVFFELGDSQHCAAIGSRIALLVCHRRCGVKLLVVVVLDVSIEQKQANVLQASGASMR